MDNKIIDNQTYQFILQNVKLLNTNISDNLAEFFINKAITEIVIKTNRNKFPNDLKYLVVDMVNDFYMENKTISDVSNNQVIQSMSEDGRSVNFGLDDLSKMKLQAFIQQKLKDNETLINRYKLLYKVRCPLDEQN